MFISQKLRKENIAEYLLYMWQIEDLLRACNMDIDIVREKYLSRFSELSPTQQKEQEQWYSDLIDMMRSEHIVQSGHLQINRNIILNLRELHNSLISSDKFPYFKAAYYDALPVIVELRKKSGVESVEEIETCFNLLYGVMLLRMQGKEIAKETEDGLKPVSSYISMLAGYFLKNEETPLVFD